MPVTKIISVFSSSKVMNFVLLPVMISEEDENAPQGLTDGSWGNCLKKY